MPAGVCPGPPPLELMEGCEKRSASLASELMLARAFLVSELKVSAAIWMSTSISTSSS
jgi:hypothetical protein